MNEFEKVRKLLSDFKGKNYLFGEGVLSKTGTCIKAGMAKAALVFDTFPGSEKYIGIIEKSIFENGAKKIDKIKGPQPNAPQTDLYRIAEELNRIKPDVLISFGGGSTIDSCKAASVLYKTGGKIDGHFGTGLVTKALAENKISLPFHIAIQTAASSGAHLTKYSNITDMATSQKKLIVDEAIIPSFSVFDFQVTYNAPAALTIDGALDGVAHCLEVLYGAVGKEDYEKVSAIAKIGITLVVKYLPEAIKNPENHTARDALCHATDLGAYAIMLGGTNGPHLNSFSFVDILSHGRACALMIPYYTVFFSPAIEKALKLVGSVYNEAGYLQENIGGLHGRELGIAVAKAMFMFAHKINFPVSLGEVSGFTTAHIEKALNAAKNPQLKMKLQNMPVPLTEQEVDTYMRPVLEAGKSGDLSIIKNI